MNNRRSRLAILEVMNVVGGSRKGIHGHSHGADFGRTKKGGHKLRRIRQHDQNTLASTNALRTQRVPRAIGKRCQFAAGYLTWFADRKSTRLNSSHDQISYAVFCLKKK